MKTEMKHTPGPCNHYDEYGCILEMKRSGLVCRKCQIDIPFPTVVTAPELLEVAKEFVDYYKKAGPATLGNGQANKTYYKLGKIIVEVEGKE